MIERSLIQILERSGPICGTAAVGFALWPDRDMQSQGAALAVSRVLKEALERGHVTCSPCDGQMRYEVTPAGSAALAAARLADVDPRQLSLLD